MTRALYKLLKGRAKSKKIQLKLRLIGQQILYSTLKELKL